MLASILAQKTMDTTEIIVDKQAFVSYYKGYTDWGNPRLDPMNGQTQPTQEYLVCRALLQNSDLRS